MIIRARSIVRVPDIKAAAAILAKAGSTDPEKLIAAAEGISHAVAVPARSLTQGPTTSRRSGLSSARPR